MIIRKKRLEKILSSVWVFIYMERDQNNKVTLNDVKDMIKEIEKQAKLKPISEEYYNIK